MNQCDYIQLYSSCVLVKGASSAIIQDLDRRKLYRISADLFEILAAQTEINCELLSQDCIDFLINFHLAFFVSTPLRGRIAPIVANYNLPFNVTNIIVDIGDNIESVSLFLLDHSINCIPTVQFRFYEETSVGDTLHILRLADKSDRINSLQVCIKQHFLDALLDLNEFQRLDLVYLFESHGYTPIKGLNYKLVPVAEPLLSHRQCGCISIEQFSNNFETYFESQHHNTCLNRKISIDVDGNIKNCPSMSKSYGNIRDTKLIDVVNNPEFQKVWHIKKDEITKCKDCEFRHVCTDCRAYLENPDDQYSAPLKCGYNPYTCEWEEWSTNPLKQKAIEFYGMQELVKKS